MEVTTLFNTIRYPRHLPLVHARCPTFIPAIQRMSLHFYNNACRMATYSKFDIDFDGTVEESRRYIAAVLGCEGFNPSESRDISRRWRGSVIILVRSEQEFIEYQLNDRAAAEAVHSALEVHRTTVRVSYRFSHF